MGHPVELRDVPDVSILWCDIEVTEDRDGVIGLTGEVELAPELTEPGQLLLEEL